MFKQKVLLPFYIYQCLLCKMKKHIIFITILSNIGKKNVYKYTLNKILDVVM